MHFVLRSFHSNRKKKIEQKQAYCSRSNAKIFENDTILFEFEKRQILDRYSIDLRFANSFYN